LAVKSKLSLPSWASWDWDQKYLPSDIHTRWNELNVALELLQKYTFADHDEGTLVVLGLGLVLRECWRAVEVEDDDETSPQFLRESLLGMRRIKEVIKVIKEVTGKLPSLDTNEEMPKEKKLDSGGKGKKGKARQKTREDNSPPRIIRSQRQRKPSQKLRGSD